MERVISHARLYIYGQLASATLPYHCVHPKMFKCRHKAIAKTRLYYVWRPYRRHLSIVLCNVAPSHCSAAAFSWNQAGCLLHHSVAVLFKVWTILKWPDSVVKSLILTLSWAADQDPCPTVALPFGSQEYRGKSLCWTSCLKQKSQQQSATEGKREREGTSFLTSAVCTLIALSSNLGTVFFCWKLICEISVSLRGHVGHYHTGHAALLQSLFYMTSSST